ncbi:hypothetical protein Cantr_08913 [Candida viswanathii]|uniref:Uncharacterized protein n=1 Tax=Candida viswanathii TaxID=5486 RepID=A0A367YAR7_9ASCO|nr:hypothetical protein Cantr_08913 [Candida viswanathii]
MNQDAIIAKLGPLVELYRKTLQRNDFNDIVKLTFAKGTNYHCLDYLLRAGFTSELISRLTFSNMKETVKYYKLLLALVVYAYQGVNKNTTPFSKLFGFWYLSDDKFKFIHKLADFAVDESIKDTDFKILILQVFSIFTVHDDYSMFNDEYYDFDMLESLPDPGAAWEGEQFPAPRFNPFRKVNMKPRMWMMKLILSFGKTDQSSMTEWQVALAKFFQTFVSSRRHAKPVLMLLEATKATSYFTVKATKGSIGAVRFLKHAMDSYAEFSDLKQTLRLKFGNRVEFMTRLESVKSSFDWTEDSFTELLCQYLSLSDAKQLLDIYVSPRKQVNFEGMKYFTLEEDTKRFYIDIILTGVFESLPSYDSFWERITEASFEDIPRYIKFATNYPSMTMFISDLQNEMLDQIKREILQHLTLITGRVKINGPDSFSGNSKYFWKVKSIVSERAKEYQVELDGVNTNDFKYALAVTLCKPNKASAIKKFGIDKLRIGRVERNRGSHIFKCENLDLLDYTHLVFLPSTDSLKGWDITKYHQALMYSLSPEVKFLMLSSPIDDAIDRTKDDELVQVMGTYQYSDIRHILPDLFEPHTVVIVPSEAYLGQYKDVKMFRYGDAESVEDMINFADSVFENLQKCTGMQEILHFKEIALMQQLVEVTVNCLDAWRATLEECTLKRKMLPVEFQRITNGAPLENAADLLRFSERMTHIVPVILLCWDLLKKELNLDTWKFICRNCPVMITVDDWVRVINDFETTESVVLLNCHASVLMMACSFVNWTEGRPGCVKIVGGNMADYFFYKRSKRNTKPANTAPIVKAPKLIAGFKRQIQYISVKDQVEDAEYCVTLYHYMTKLGYPTDSIGIWVSCQRQLDLIKEVADTLLPTTIDRPSVLFNKSGVYDYIHYKYSIISLFTDSDFKEVRMPGQLTNFYVSTNVAADRLYFPDRSSFIQIAKLPEVDKLETVPGERYGLTERQSENVIVVEDLQHLKRLVDEI